MPSHPRHQLRPGLRPLLVALALQPLLAAGALAQSKVPAVPDGAIARCEEALGVWMTARKKTGPVALKADVRANRLGSSSWRLRGAGAMDTGEPGDRRYQTFDYSCTFATTSQRARIDSYSEGERRGELPQTIVIEAPATPGGRAAQAVTDALTRGSASDDAAFQKRWAQSTSPAVGVTCYPEQRACFREGSGYSAGWTQQVYGRRR